MWVYISKSTPYSQQVQLPMQGIKRKPHAQKMFEGHSARGSQHLCEWQMAAKDQNCSAPYVGAGFTEYHRVV